MQTTAVIDKSQLRPSTFWDVNFEDFDPNQHSDFVIYRLAHRGTMNEFFYLLRTFSYDEIINVLTHFRGVEPIVLNFFKQLAHASSE